MGVLTSVSWYSPMMRLSGVVLRSRETQEWRKGESGCLDFQSNFLLGINIRIWADDMGGSGGVNNLPHLRQNVCVIVGRVFSRLRILPHSVPSADSPHTTHIEHAESIVRIHNIQRITIPHNSSRVHRDLLEIIIRTRLYEQHMAVLMRRAIYKADPCLLLLVRCRLLLVPAHGPDGMAFIFPVSESVTRAADSLGVVFLRVVVAVVPAPALERFAVTGFWGFLDELSVCVREDLGHGYGLEVLGELGGVGVGGVGELEVFGIEEREFGIVAVASSRICSCDGGGGKEAEGEKGGDNHLQEWNE
jgi:hypothetical protein